jgi:hypothetical protein
MTLIYTGTTSGIELSILLDSLLKSSDGKNFHEAWSPDFVALYGKEIYDNANCLSAWKVIPYPKIVALIDAVRTRISFWGQISHVDKCMVEEGPGCLAYKNRMITGIRTVQSHVSCTPNFHIYIV